MKKNDFQNGIVKSSFTRTNVNQFMKGGNLSVPNVFHTLFLMRYAIWILMRYIFFFFLTKDE